MRTVFFRRRPAALAALAVFGAALMATAAPQASAQQWGATEQRIRCESYGAGEQYCRAPNDGRVRLVRNLSNVYCVEGRNWRADRNGIVVREGCRGEFSFMGTGGGMGGGWNDQNNNMGEVEVRCDSEDGRESFCGVTNRGVRLVRTVSRAPCVEGNTWRADGRGIYVRSGCRGVFLARTNQQTGGGWNNGGNAGWGSGGGGGWGNNNYGPPMQIRCQSIGGRWGACPVEINGRVRLARRESNAPCTRGMTWGTIRNEAIWVSDGCRAIFEIQGGRPMTGRSNYDGAGMAPPGVSRRAIPEDSDGPPMKGPDPQGPGVSREAPR
jgi:hypothetical protein